MRWLRDSLRLGPRAPLLAPAAFVWAALFAAPLASFFLFSFWSVRARVMRPDLTAKNYVATFTQYGDVLIATLAIAFAIACVTTLLAFAFAFAITDHDLPGQPVARRLPCGFAPCRGRAPAR